MLNLLIDRVLIGDDLLTASFPLLFQRVKVQAKQNKNKNNNKHGKNHLPVQCVNSYNILKTFMEACQKGDNFECHCLKYFFSTVSVLRRIILCVVGCFCGDSVCVSKYIPELKCLSCSLQHSFQLLVQQNQPLWKFVYPVTMFALTPASYCCQHLGVLYIHVYTHTWKLLLQLNKKSIGHQRKCWRKQHFAAIWICISIDDQPARKLHWSSLL